MQSGFKKKEKEKIKYDITIQIFDTRACSGVDYICTRRDSTVQDISQTRLWDKLDLACIIRSATIK